MKLLRVWPCIVAIVLLVPTALALPALEASSVAVAGTVEMTASDATAVFVLFTEAEFEWDLTASGGVVERLHSSFVAATTPNNEHYYLRENSEWETERFDISDVSIASTSVAPRGALLITSDAAQVAAESAGLVRVAATSDPRVEQEPLDASTSDGDDGIIRTRLSGDYLRLALSDGALTISGDVTLTLFGPSYSLTSAEGTREMRTGDWEEMNGIVAFQGRMERHTLTLADAVLRIRAPGGADIYTSFPEMLFDGTLQADGADGALAIDDQLIAPTDGALTWTGATTLVLSPASGRVLATTPDTALASTAVAPTGASVAILPLILGAVALACAAAIVLWIRHARKDDLDLALLAMEERRWDDALPRLTRLAKKRPADAAVQLDRALCLDQTGRFDEAAKAFEAALRAAPRQAETHFYYARTLAKMSEREAARVHLETALEHDPRLVEMARGEVVLRGL